MLYLTTYHSPHTYETRILPTLRAVELWAESLLSGVHVTTTRDCYWRDVCRAPSVTWQTTASKAQPCYDGTDEYYVNVPLRRGEILPPITIVSSVGEIGITP